MTLPIDAIDDCRRRLRGRPPIALALGCAWLTGCGNLLGVDWDTAHLASSDAAASETGASGDSATGGGDTTADVADALSDVQEATADVGDAGMADGDGMPDVSQEVSTSDAPEDTKTEGPTCTCVDDLSNIGLADFYVAFTITTNATVPMAILNQRSTCDATHPFWDVQTGTNLGINGVVFIQVGDGSNIFDDQSTQQTVTDNQPHRVVIARTNSGNTFTLTVDGQGTPQVGAATEPLTGTLPSLQTGTDVCTTYEPIAGQLTNVCITVGCPIQ